MRLPADVEKAILEILGLPDLQRRTTPTYEKRIGRIRKQLRALSDAFAASLRSEDKYADAYLAYNVPRNFLEAMIIGRDVAAFAPHTCNKEKIDILDIGCGAGAGMLGLYYSLRNSVDFSLTGIDTATRFLTDCRKLTDRLLGRTNIRTTLRRYDLSDGLIPTKQKFDIVILTHSLAEMHPKNIPTRFLHRLFRNVAESGLVVIIEPAVRQLSRRLVDLRNAIVTDQKLSVLLPCPHDQECPLHTIRNRKEWCHQSIQWHPPDFMKIINRGLNREITTLKFSYLIISRKRSSTVPKNQYLVISTLLTEKGKQKCFLCTPTGRLKLVRLNKNRTERNRTFDEIQKGDMISARHIVKERGYWSVAPETVIHIHHSRHY